MSSHVVVSACASLCVLLSFCLVPHPSPPVVLCARAAAHRVSMEAGRRERQQRWSSDRGHVSEVAGSAGLGGQGRRCFARAACWCWRLCPFRVCPRGLLLVRPSVCCLPFLLAVPSVCCWRFRPGRALSVLPPSACAFVLVASVVSLSALRRSRLRAGLSSACCLVLLRSVSAAAATPATPAGL